MSEVRFTYEKTRLPLGILQNATVERTMKARSSESLALRLRARAGLRDILAQNVTDCGEPAHRDLSLQLEHGLRPAASRVRMAAGFPPPPADSGSRRSRLGI